MVLLDDLTHYLVTHLVLMEPLLPLEFSTEELSTSFKLFLVREAVSPRVCF